jgi:class 3 adenylate cyclase
MPETRLCELNLRLLHAAARGDLETLIGLVARGADIDMCDYNKRTSLHLAAERNHLDVVYYLVHQGGAEIDCLDSFGLSPLDLAIRNHHCSVVGALAPARRSNSTVRRSPSPPSFFHGNSDCEAVIRSSFPASVASAMIQGRPIIPKTHTSVSLFFSNIVDYPALRASMRPEALLDILERLFQRLDALAASHGVQTVDTIDGCYIAATNLFADQTADHANRLACFALDAIAAAEDTLVDPRRPELGGVRMRAGLHCGAVSACVIGAHGGLKHTLLGDTVNVASRMESQGAAGSVQCSGAMAALIGAQGGWGSLCRREGGLEVKGRGRMQTFWLSRSPPPPAVEAEAKTGVTTVCIDVGDCQPPSGPGATSPSAGPAEPRGDWRAGGGAGWVPPLDFVE